MSREKEFYYYEFPNGKRMGFDQKYEEVKPYIRDHIELINKGKPKEVFYE